MSELGKGTVGLIAAVMWFAAAAHANAGSGTQGLTQAVGIGQVSSPDSILLDCVEGQQCASDGNACTLDVCHNNQCTHPYDESHCAGDPDPCVVWVCIAPFGDCGSGTRGCYDANPCTNDACVSAAGGCVYTNNSSPCNDGNGCTVNDVCSGGACGGTPIAPPQEVTNDRFSNHVRFMWTAVADPSAGTLDYDVARGIVSALPSGTGGSETCRVSGVTETFVDLSEIPPVDEGFWYLVRARNSCGNGGWGSWSSGQPRSTVACP